MMQIRQLQIRHLQVHVLVAAAARDWRGVLAVGNAHYAAHATCKLQNTVTVDARAHACTHAHGACGRSKGKRRCTEAVPAVSAPPNSEFET
eukprot:261993-Chlamydomonas_euryale.AAC.4